MGFSFLKLLDPVFFNFFPSSCLLCHQLTPQKMLCQICYQKAWLPITQTQCACCGNVLPEDSISVIQQSSIYCGKCLTSPQEKIFYSITSLLWFSEVNRKTIYHIKYGGKNHWLSFYKNLFDKVTKTPPFFFSSSKVIIPIPLHYLRYGKRGFNVSDTLSQWLLKKWGGLIDSQSLKRIRNTPFQSRLKNSHRRKNVHNAFLWQSRERAPEEVILVDDVFTSGETMREASSTLIKNGTKIIHVWSLFRTPTLSLF